MKLFALYPFPLAMFWATDNAVGGNICNDTQARLPHFIILPAIPENQATSLFHRPTISPRYRSFCSLRDLVP
jgi:hypothetical protein